MKWYRNNDNWLRYQVEQEVKKEHPALLKKRGWFTRVKEYAFDPRHWWLILSFVLIVFAVSWMLSFIDFLNCINLKYDTARSLIDQYTANIAAIAGLAFVVVGFLINYLSGKDSTTFEILTKKTKIYPIVYFALSTIACLFLLSMLKDQIPVKEFIRLVVTATYLAIFIIGCIGFLFYQIGKFSHESYVIKIIINDYKTLVLEYLSERYMQSKSRGKIMDLFSTEAGLSIGRTAELKENNSQKFDVITSNDIVRKNDKTTIWDINIGAINQLIKKHNLPIRNYCYNIMINKTFNEIDETIFFTDASIFTKQDVAILRKSIILKRTRPEDDNLNKYQKFLISKLQVALDNKNSELLAATLEGFLEIYRFEASISPESFDNIITQFFDTNIYRTIETSIKSDNYELYTIIDNYFLKIISLLLNYKKTDNARRFMACVGYSYFTFLDVYEPMDDKVNPKYNVYINKSLHNLRELIYMISKQQGFGLDVKNVLYDEIFKQYSSLLFNGYKYGNVPLFKFIVDRISSTFQSEIFNEKHRVRLGNYSLEGEIKNAIEEKLWEEKCSYYQQKCYFDNLSRRIFIGIKYWILNSFEHGNRDVEYYTSFSKLIPETKVDTWSTMEDLIFYESDNVKNGFLKWNERRLAESYPFGFDPEIWEVEAWLYKGFVIEQLEKEDFNLQVHNVSQNLVIEAGDLYDKLEKISIDVLRNKKRWCQYLNIEVDELNARLEKFLETFKKLQTAGNNLRIHLLNNRDLDSTKLDEFKRKLLERFISTPNLVQLFREKGNIEILTGLQKKIETTFDFKKSGFIGGKYFRDNHKCIDFIEFHRRKITSRFFNTVSEKHNKVLDDKSLAVQIDIYLQELRAKEYKPNLIIFSLTHENNGKSRDIRESPNFEKNDKNESVGIKYWGTYNNIPIILFVGNKIGDFLVVCEFEKAFGLKIKRDASFIDEVVEFEIKMNSTNDNNVADDAQSQLEEPIVSISLQTFLEFDVKDENAYIVGKSTIANAPNSNVPN